MTVLEVYDAAAGLPQPRPARAEDGLLLAAYFGDTNGDQRYTGADVTLLQRLALGSASGLADFRSADPVIPADLNRTGAVTGADATLMQRAIVGMDVPTVPILPAGVTPPPAAGADPRVFIPRDLSAERGQTVSVPVNLEVTEPAGLTLSSVDLVIEYDADRFTVGNFREGALLQGAGFSAPLVNTDTPGILRLTMSTAGSTVLLPLGTTGPLLLMDFTVQDSAAAGGAPLNLRADYSDGVRTTTTNLADGQVRPLVLAPAPTNLAADAVDGLFAVQEKPAASWHNLAKPHDVTGDGRVTPLDVLTVVNYVNAHPGESLLPPPPVPVPAYYDVNDDGRCTALDVLLVINYLNSGLAGEGEWADDLAADIAVAWRSN